jgi:plastocyanin
MRARAARLAALAGLLLFIALASTAAAATEKVEIEGFAFRPTPVTINAGDTVTWTNKDQAAHSAVFASGGPQTPVLANGQSAPLTFTTAGTFNYVCGIHGASMSGTVIVRAAATLSPSAAPTSVPTAAPTAPQTIAPTIAPTNTIAPTQQSTATASPAPTATASSAATPAAPSATTVPSVAVAAPTQQAPAPAASNDGGASPLLIGGAVVAVIGLAAFALTRIRR